MHPVDHYAIDKDLKRLKKAISTIAEHPAGYIPFMRHLAAKSGNGQGRILGVIRAVHVIKESGCLTQALNDYEFWARSAVDQMPNRKNINWTAVHAISQLRFYWRAGSLGRVAPRRALNPSCQFANYLRDAFDFFGVEGDPISAFKRWAALAAKHRGLVR
jgi:hypothetical protein